MKYLNDQAKFSHSFAPQAFVWVKPASPPSVEVFSYTVGVQDTVQWTYSPNNEPGGDFRTVAPTVGQTFQLSLTEYRNKADSATGTSIAQLGSGQLQSSGSLTFTIPSTIVPNTNTNYGYAFAITVNTNPTQTVYSPFIKLNPAAAQQTTPAGTGNASGRRVNEKAVWGGVVLAGVAVLVGLM
ncbi:hypothetical protein HK097_009387 [Rhizophlyctis rosea]|uniref:Uncharacterized protein n=1 Tax=Rhizophlyctis rosea TaxID=64517 RepID=A0AAD5SB82_9FUNG|nr:hypothetical protein HK097_009387 [Rhizophlyctis rosea]